MPISRINSKPKQRAAGVFPAVWAHTAGINPGARCWRGVFSSALALVLICTGLVTGADEPVPEHARPLLGSWQNVDKDQQSTLCFQAAKCVLFEKGRLLVFTAKYEPGKVVLRSLAQKAVWQTDLKDGVLKLTMADGTRKLILRKLDSVPPELEVKALALGKAEPLPAQKLKVIQEELAKRLIVDQAVRKDPARWKEMQQVDADNTAYLVQLVKEVGWIDPERFGKEIWNAAFLIVQHSEHLPLMLAVRPAIDNDFKAKRIDAQPYALLHDRLQLLLGEKQRYGTQMSQNAKGEWVILPLENPAKVEQFRKEIGLFSLAQYIEVFKQINRIKDVKFQDDE